jgi:transcriptional regulator with XRE-family HTH domain
MIHIYFRKTQEHYGITGKRLSEMSGVSENHISEFRRGKSTISVEVLWKLVLGMDAIEPGARKYFCSLMADEANKPGEAKKPVESLEARVEKASDEEMEAVMLAIARRWRRSRSPQSSLIGV